mmetsp:Transcript_12580/g.46479  ORF Transcript_12580/g.46479 Transcript_12580/m.46479 type:complete len:266 (+) Transcript_12580:645-1442(+)|eukprot:scaffold1087_cov198-Pinguiococcus_pyrenoidosus.AAC.20
MQDVAQHHDVVARGALHEVGLQMRRRAVAASLPAARGEAVEEPGHGQRDEHEAAEHEIRRRRIDAIDARHEPRRPPQRRLEANDLAAEFLLRPVAAVGLGTGVVCALPALPLLPLLRPLLLLLLLLLVLVLPDLVHRGPSIRLLVHEGAGRSPDHELVLVLRVQVLDRQHEGQPRAAVLVELDRPIPRDCLAIHLEEHVTELKLVVQGAAVVDARDQDAHHVLRSDLLHRAIQAQALAQRGGLHPLNENARVTDLGLLAALHVRV